MTGMTRDDQGCQAMTEMTRMTRDDLGVTGDDYGRLGLTRDD